MSRSLVCAALLVAACARYSTESTMQSWVGAEQSKLVSEWGAPDLTFAQPDSTRVLTWIKRYSETVSLDGQTKPRECRQSFTVSPLGKVLKWSTTGAC